MTAESYSIAVLPSDVLRSSSTATIRSLREVINRGYDVPRQKYGIILSPRIQSVDSLLEDLGFDDTKGRCWLYLLLNDRQSALQDFDQEFLRIKVEENAYDTNNVFFTPKSHSLKKAFQKEQILATIGFKAIDKGNYEVTAFTSVGGGCGIKLFNDSILNLSREDILCKKLSASIILEHDLLGYYERLGFVEVERLKVLKGVRQEEVFSNRIEFSRDFHVVQMEKVLA